MGKRGKKGIRKVTGTGGKEKSIVGVFSNYRLTLQAQRHTLSEDVSAADMLMHPVSTRTADCDISLPSLCVCQQ